MTKLIDFCVNTIFRNRIIVIILFALTTAFLGYQSSQLKLDAGFTKNIPLNHEYMVNYMKHAKDFGGANSILVSVCDKDSDIFNTEFFDTLKNVHDQLFFINGVERSLVKSLFSSSTRFTEIVEGGFSGGPVIPADFDSTNPDALALVSQNIDKAGIVGQLVSDDFKCAMVSAQLLNIDPATGEKLDTLVLADQLEEQLRGKFENENTTIHIIGFAKMIGDVANGAKDVLLFFAIALAITAVMVYFFSKSIMLTILPLLCSVIAVVWQLGLLTILGFGLDPMSILVPFLVFAIGVSHGVQMINAVGKRVVEGGTALFAAESAFRTLLIPGGIALLSDTVGFMTLLVIDIGIIRELAITASLGVAVIILTNLILLPVLMSYVKFSDSYKNKFKNKENRSDKFWNTIAHCSTPKVAYLILIVTAVLFVFGWLQSSKMKIGDLHAGAPALHESSRYNQDTFLITDKYAISVDYISILVETTPEACTSYEVMNAIDELQWKMGNIEGVQSTVSLPSVAKLVNAGYNEGNPKWRVIPRNQQTLVQAIAQIPTSSGLLNTNCSVMPIILFMEDHKAETIKRVVDAVKVFRQDYETDELKFSLASGPVGVMAAKNEAVDDAQNPMMMYVFGAVIILCLLSFRSLRATMSVVIPLYVVSVLAQALMTFLEIGLTVSTLPVIALGVGIGVDYGIYILSTMNIKLKSGMPVRQAYFEALKERGSAVLFTGITLAVGVSTWVFSSLKFQMDMGILLTFMFVVNMLGAIVVLPALAAVFWRKQK
ncbi:MULTISPECIES: efflux RND transporter permease subunit [Alteromonadaceae]|uniref:efflux RND transporter permease subunit n=1 Tax=Alteromonadaceae TaxID=72275 RepID=UPI001C0A22DB|nr:MULTISPECIES: MMPL family transporter [Aliiglaciecola]MBU2876304.1 MMPL family transporter [Aliiglaciecola lipolytica]MDO6710520.1 MMPL family transporter [Aliiglaciecola sp. 2_MG-2023]MDO6751615.1 MMPL family transporter [Aliiglaciecola sp. 1_MG-2023]